MNDPVENALDNLMSSLPGAAITPKMVGCIVGFFALVAAGFIGGFYVYDLFSGP